MPTQDIAELIISCKTKNIEEVERVTKEVDKADKAANKLLKTLGNLVTAAAVFKVFKGGVQTFIAAEEATSALDAAFRRLGKTNAAYRRELTELNAALAKSTIYTTAELAASQALALNMGISSDNIKKVTEAAIGLSAAYGKSLGGAMRMLALAANGNYIMLKRLGIQVDSSLSPAENFAKILDQLAGTMEEAQAKTKTTGGAITQMNKSLAGAKAALGEQLAPYVKDAAGLIGGLADKFANAEPETKRFVTVMGTVTMGLLALKSAIGLKAIADNLSGATGVAASVAKQKATKEEIALEKALQKEKMATIALEQAKEKVAAAKSAVAIAESKRNDVMKGPGIGGRVNLDAIQAADNGVTAAKEQLAAAEKELQKLTAAHNRAANGVELLKAANEKSIPVIDNRLELEKKVAAADKASEKATNALVAADERLAAARKRVAEVKRGRDEAFTNWRNNLEDEGAYGELRAKSQSLESAKKNYEAARSEVARLEKEFNKANAAVIAANAELKALGPTAETVSAEMQKLGTTSATASTEMKALGTTSATASTEMKALGTTTTTTQAGLKTLGTSANVAAAGLKNMGFSAAASGKQMTFMRRQFTTFPTFARGARALGGAMRGVGVAFRGAAAAAKSFAMSTLWMAALSAAIAGIDWLLRRPIVAADAAINSAQSRLDDIRKKSSEYAAKAEDDQTKLETLKTLSQYTRLTNEEQTTAQQIISELSKSYDGLGNSIQFVNGKLVINGDLNKKIDEHQKRKKKNLLEREIKETQQTFEAMYNGYYGKNNGLFSTAWENTKSLGASLIGYGKTDRDKIDSLFIKASYASPEKGVDFLKEAKNIAIANGEMEDQAEHIQKMIDLLTEEAKKRKELAELNNPGQKKKDTKKALEDSKKDLADFAKARESLESRKWSIEYDLANPEGKTDMLQKKIDDLAKRRDDALERAPNDRKKQTEAIQLSEKMIDLEKQKAAIMQEADNKRVEDMKKAAKEEEEFLQWAMKATSSLKDTTQNAIDANSIDAVRMQSRSLDDGGGGLLSAAQNAANAAKAATDAAAKSVRIQQQMKSVIDNIYTKLANLGTSSVG